jgi:hypothetical protein
MPPRLNTNPEEKSQLIRLFTETQDRASRERKEQTVLWTAALDRLRMDFRIAGVLMLFSILALSGINVAASNGLFKLDLSRPTVKATTASTASE